MPIVADLLSSRFAFRLRNSDPYQTQRLRQRDLRSSARRAEGSNSAAAPRRRATSAASAATRCGHRRDLAHSGRPRRRGRHRGQLGRARVPAPPAARHRSRLRAQRARQPARRGPDLRPGDRHRARVRVQRVASSAAAAGEPDRGYQEPDQRPEVDAALRRRQRCPSGGSSPIRSLTRSSKVLAEKRPLDRKPYRGDYNRAGETTRDTWGGYLSGKARARRLRDLRARLVRRLRALPRSGHRLHARHPVRGRSRATRPGRPTRSSTSAGELESDAARVGDRRLLPVRGRSTTSSVDAAREREPDRAHLLAGHAQLRPVGEVHLGLPRRRDARGGRALELGAQELRDLPAAADRRRRHRSGAASGSPTRPGRRRPAT